MPRRLSVVNAVHKALQTARAAAPPGMQINELFDQSVFVKQSVAGVLREGAIAAGADGADDPAVPGIVAFDAGGDDLDSAFDPGFAGRAVFPRRDPEHDDARRAGAGGRYSGGRFDRHDREHPSPAHRGRDAAAAGHAAWRRRHCDPDAGVDAGDQLRLHLGGIPRRTGKISVHPAGACGGVRDAGVLRLFANPDADRHRLAAQGRKSRPGRQRRRAACSPVSMPLSSAASRRCATAIRARSPG